MIHSLLNRYEKEWAELQGKPIPAGTIRPTNPLLLNVPPAYFNADYKVMVFGQENNDWERAFPHQGGVSHMLEKYQKFYNEGDCYTKQGGQWWNGIKNFKARLQERSRSNGKSVHLLWNNLIKIGKKGEKGVPPQAIIDWQDKWFDLVRYEVCELSPNIVVFFAGPSYDRYIERIFPNTTFAEVNHRPVRQLARITASGFLPERSVIRTYYPNFLYHQGRARFAEIMAEIIVAVEM